MTDHALNCLPGHAGNLIEPASALAGRPWHSSGRVAGLNHGKLGRVHWRERRLPGQHPRHLMRGKVTDRADRLFGVVRRVWRDDHVVQAEERVRRLPVPLLGRSLFDVVQAGAGDPALFESRVRMARGLRSCWISETSCLPVARA